MESIPSGLMSALTSGVSVEFTVDAYQGGSKTATLDIIDGSITQSWLSSVRRTCSFTIAGWDGIVPDQVVEGVRRLYGDGTYGSGIYGGESRSYLMGLLLPYKTQVKVNATYTWSGGTQTVNLGWFVLNETTYQDKADGSFQVACTGFDLAGLLALNRFSSPVKLTGSQTLTQAITTILTPVLPSGVTLSLLSTTEPSAEQVYLPGGGQSQWEVARGIAEMAGWNLYVTRNKTIGCEVIPSLSGTLTPVYTLSDTVNLLDVEYAPSAREFVNKVIVTGEASKNDQLVATAEDLSSPYSAESIGATIVREERTEKGATQGQCQNLANALLRRYGRLMLRVTGDCAPIPHMEVGDVVRIIDQQLGLDDAFVLESIEFPLSATEPCRFTAAKGV